MKLNRLIILLLIVLIMSACTDKNTDKSKDKLLLDDSPFALTSNPLPWIYKSTGYVTPIKAIKDVLGEPKEVIVIDDKTLYIYDAETVLVVLVNEDLQSMTTYWHFIDTLMTSDFSGVKAGTNLDDIILLDPTTELYSFSDTYFTYHRLADGTIMRINYDMIDNQYTVSELSVDEDEDKVITEAYVRYTMFED